MENVLQITNPMIKKTDNMLKTELINVKDLIFNKGVYGQTGVLEIEKNSDYLSMLFLKITLVVDNLSTNGLKNTDKLAFNLFEELNLMPENMMNIKPCYQHIEFNERYGTRLYTAIENSITPNPGFISSPMTTTTAEFMIPLPFFFSMPNSEFLNIRKMETIKINLKVASKENIGLIDLDTDLNAVINYRRVELVQKGFTKGFFSRQQSEQYFKTVPRTLKNTFDVFYEDIQEIAPLANSHKMLLRCPYPLMSISAIIYNSDNFYTINKMGITTKNNKMRDLMTRKTNYSYNTEKFSLGQSNSITYWINEDDEIFNTKSLTTFSGEDSQFPTYLNLEFDEIGPLISEVKLYVCCRFLTDIKVNDKSKISNIDTSSYLTKNNGNLYN